MLILVQQVSYGYTEWHLRRAKETTNKPTIKFNKGGIVGFANISLNDYAHSLLWVPLASVMTESLFAKSVLHLKEWT